MISDFLWIVLLLNLWAMLSTVFALALGFPAPLRNYIKQNCFRADGTFSDRRAHREMRHLADSALPLLAFFAALLLLVNMLATIVHTSVIPLPIVARAVNEFRLDGHKWRKHIEDTGARKEYERWYRETSVNPEGEEFWETVLWHGWPLFLGIPAVAGFFALKFFRKAWLGSLFRLQEGVLDRRQEYFFRDLGLGLHAASHDLGEHRDDPGHDQDSDGEKAEGDAGSD
ncbi:MAG: hypothetical protein ACLQNE_02240 [Thermoguttaceae bacterium]